MAHQHQHQQQQQQQQHALPLQSQKPPAIDWLSFPAPTVVDAPHPDLFDFELDNSLSDFDQAQVQLLQLDYNAAEAFQYYRSETPQGPPSVLTASSESAYDTLSAYSESLSLHSYTNPSPSQYGIDYSQQPPPDLGIDFAAFNIMSDHGDNRSSYSYNGSYDVSATRSTYSANAGFVPNTATGIAPPLVGPLHAGSAESPKSSSEGSRPSPEADPRKKYACPNCTRSFARAYNLKTHLATHDPQRLKPYVCPHRACGRSFSRKHDLGRHLVSIHREETGSQYSVASGHSTASERHSEHPASTRGGVGISADNAVRSWCEQCGRGWIGQQRACTCADVK